MTARKPSPQSPANATEADRSPAVTTIRMTQTRMAATTLLVIAHAYYVGVRGRCGVVLIVPWCSYCGRSHRHNGKPGATSFRRLASCHGGRYQLHVGVIEGAA